MTFEAVQSAMAVGEWPAALRAALSTWRTCRQPVVADVIDALSVRALDAAALSVPKTSDDMQLAWVQQSTMADVVSIGWLAQHLTTRVPVDRYGRLIATDLVTGKYRAWMERLERMEALEPDPRIAAAAVAAFEAPPYSLLEARETASLYAPLLRILKKCGDLRGLARLRAHLQNPSSSPRIREVQLDNLPRAIHMVEQAAVKPLENEARWRELLKVKTAPLVDQEARLFEAVVNAVDDDRPRQVYADWLSERGDPRGEFISLQLMKPQRSDSDERHFAQTLLQQHEDAWLGPLARLVTAHWQRGFVSAMTVNAAIGGTDARWQAAADAHQLGTVRTILPGEGAEERAMELLCSPHSRNVSSATFRTHRAIDRIRESPMIETLSHLTLLEQDFGLGVFKLSGFRLPALKSLKMRFRADDLKSPMMKLLWLQQLRELECELEGKMTVGAVVTWAWPPLKLDTLKVRTSAGLHVFRRVAQGLAYECESNEAAVNQAVELIRAGTAPLVSVGFDAADPLVAHALLQGRLSKHEQLLRQTALKAGIPFNTPQR